MLNTKLAFRLVSLFLVLPMLLAPWQGTPSHALEQPASIYIDPELLALQTGQVSIILTADSVQTAARAVQRAGGRVTSELWLINAAAAIVPAEVLEQLAHLPGVRSMVINKSIRTAGKPTPTETSSDPVSSASNDWLSNGSTLGTNDGWVTSFRFPVPWDGTPDVQPTSSWNSRKLVYPVNIDIGADQVYWTGSGVTVAIVDSGVYFDDQVKIEMGSYLRKLFYGQADFFQASCETIQVNNQIVVKGQQYPDYCFTGRNDSRDGYGHGTHVAGIIWNRISDYITGVDFGVAREAKILGIRVLGDDGVGTYETVIKGVQFAVANKAKYNIRVLNLSLSSPQSVPYFIDPLNRAVEQAWQSGIVVVAAAGNEGPEVESITVPGNDPYVITVGAVDGRRTPGYWQDDIIPSWSASGPTLDGFLKPDLVAPGTQIVSFMHNNHTDSQSSAYLVQQHPDYSLTSSLFRMSGTSMATAVTSGVVALMLQKNPGLTPDQVKYRLMATARQVSAPDGQPAFNLLQQGAGRIWAPDAVDGILPDGRANASMDLAEDLAAGWGYLDGEGGAVLDQTELAKHYLGQVRNLSSVDGQYRLYYVQNAGGIRVVLGISDANSKQWMLLDQLPEGTAWTVGRLTWSGGSELNWAESGLSWYSDALYDGAGKLIWSGGVLVWSGDELYDAFGSLVWSEGDLFDAAGKLIWSGGKLIWSGGYDLTWSEQGWEWNSTELFDGSGRLIWSGGRLIWSGGQLFDTAGKMIWSGGELFDAAGKMIWSGGKLIWSGAQLADSAGALIWAGGKLIWSGSVLQSSSGSSYSPEIYDTSLAGENLSWSSSKMIWSGGLMVWSGNTDSWAASKLILSGGRLIWSGNLDWTNSSGASMQASRWVDW